VSAQLVERVKREKPTFAKCTSLPASPARADRHALRYRRCHAGWSRQRRAMGSHHAGHAGPRGRDSSRWSFPNCAPRAVSDRVRSRTLRENLGLRPVTSRYSRGRYSQDRRARSKPCQSSTSRFIPSIEINPGPAVGQSLARTRLRHRRRDDRCDEQRRLSTARSWCRRSAAYDTIPATRSRYTTPIGQVSWFVRRSTRPIRDRHVVARWAVTPGGARHVAILCADGLPMDADHPA